MAKKDIPDLYDQEWPKDADNRTFKLKQVSCENHKFKYMKKANEVKCDCGIGYFLSGGMEVNKDGHIYYQGSLVI